MFGSLQTTAIAAGIAFVIGASSGWKVTSWYYQSKEAAAIKEANRKQQQIHDAEIAYLAANRETEIRYVTIDREVDRYVEADPADPVCFDDVGVRLINRALTGETIGNPDTTMP